MIQAAIFYFLSALVLISAVMVVALRNVFHSALWLMASLSGVAGLYAMMGADFLFAVQLLVYIGGIMVVLLFVVLLSGRPSDWAGRQVNEKAWVAALFAVFVSVALGAAVSEWPMAPVSADLKVTTPQLGDLLLSDMVLPFELISLVLVVALVGAVYFSSKKPS